MKPTGRRRIDPDDESVQVCVTLPARQYDAIANKALRADLSVPEVIRRQLDRSASTPDRAPRR